MRVAIIGSERLSETARTLGLEAVDDRPDLVLVELAAAGAIARAERIGAAVPRIVIGDEAATAVVRASGLDPSRIAPSPEPEVLGPLVRAVLPPRPRPATRLVLVTAVRGGVGRTVLAANIAERIARRAPVWVVDATGTGAVGWWLRADGKPWSELEAAASELDGDALRIVAAEPRPGLHLLGAGPFAPSRDLLRAVLTALRGLDELVLVDAPPLADERARDMAASADRVLVVSYADPLSIASLAGQTLDPEWWLLASQSASSRVGAVTAFRALPRDERALAASLASRGPVGGPLGRAYDDLADLLWIDAS